MSKTFQLGILATACLLCTTIVNAKAVDHSPRLTGALQYQIGGGFISDAPTKINTVPVLELGVGWDLNMECGEFDPKITVSNQLNGITDGFKNMMDNIISSATGAVAGLPALAIQRANPGLYDMLQQGILQGKLDFEWAATSCDQMANVMMGDESFPFEKYKLSIKSNEWAQEISASGGDAIAAKDAMESSQHGDAGAEWVCGAKRGGINQPPINALKDVVQVGYNVMYDRANSCDTSTVGSSLGNDTPLWMYWNGPIAASTWATRVIGDIEMRTCDGCTKMRGVPGKGLTFMHQDLTAIITSDLEDLVSGATTLSWQNLNRVSAPPGVQIYDTIIMSIRTRDAIGQAEMIRKLASEVAYARIVEQGRLLTQLLRTGVKEPNVSSFDPAKIVVADAVDVLQVELQQLEMEIRTRKAIAKDTIHLLLGYEERSVQEMDVSRRVRPVNVNQHGVPQ
jgi:integrating conjugative element protein (TIGR03755 family)